MSTNTVERECNTVAEGVHDQSYGDGLTDLTFDPATGEFRQVAQGEVPRSGSVVTPMTKDGFAAEGDSGKIVYANQEEVAEFVQGTQDALEGHAYEWEGEGVVHVHLRPLSHAHGAHSKCLVCKGEQVPADASARYVLMVGQQGTAAECRLFSADDGYGQSAKVEFVPAREELYSRNQGLLERDTLSRRRVLIVGLGSFGSQIAIELAKAGVGELALCDFDRVELHNLVRHTGTTADLGRLKTDVVADAVLGKNPYARVDRLAIDINDHLDQLAEEVEKADLVICATDNNRSRFNLTNVLAEHPKVCIFGRAVTRAEGGDVFVARPGGACYNCLIGNGWYDSSAEEIATVESGRRSGRIAAYMSDADANAVVQVGLSADIAPICNMMVKLALVELSRGTDSGITSLEHELVYNYYLWANRRERRYANWSAMPTAGNSPTILRWYGAKIARRGDCATCGETAAPTLDVGAELAEKIELPSADFTVDLEG